MPKKTSMDVISRFNSFLDKTDGQELVAIYDIGTKAIRILIAPKEVPNDSAWNIRKKNDFLFFNDSCVPRLGAELVFNNWVNIQHSKALEEIISFIQFYNELLIESGRVDKYNINAVGTAVFRWMSNKEDVLKYIYNRTDVNVSIISKKDEALLSCLSVLHTYKINSKDQQYELKVEDAVLLIDQGGGSTEISYFFPKIASLGGIESINQLGTVVLQENFFSLDNGRLINPSDNRNSIKKQFELVSQYIQNKLDHCSGLNEMDLDNVNVYAFAMGSAVGSSTKEHNKQWTIDSIQTKYLNTLKELDRDYKQVRYLYQNINKQYNDRAKKRIEKKITALYGLPVYEFILEKFNIQSIQFAGYGLRYGAYLAKYLYAYDLNKLPDKIKMEENPIYRKKEEKLEEIEILRAQILNIKQKVAKSNSKLKESEKNELLSSLKSLIEQKDKKEEENKPKRIFISYSHKNEQFKDELIRQLTPLKQQGIISVWHDRDIEGGGEWDKQIKDEIERTDVFLLLITSDFLASDYINSVEIKRAYEKYKKGQSKIFPIICDFCQWAIQPITHSETEVHPKHKREMKIWLGKFQAYPQDAVPIVSNKWQNRNEAYANILDSLIEELI